METISVYCALDDFLLTITQCAYPILERLYVLHKITWRWSFSVSRYGRIVRVGDIAARFESGLKGITVRFREHRGFFQMLRVDVVAVASNDMEESNFFKRTFPRSPQFVIDGHGSLTVLLFLIALIERFRRSCFLFEVVDSLLNALRLPWQTLLNYARSGGSATYGDKLEWSLVCIGEVMQVVHENEVVREYDDLALLCLFHEAFGYLLAPAVIQGGYRIIEHQRRTVGGGREFCKESSQSHAGLLAFAEDIAYRGVRIGKQTNLILR